MAKKGRPFVYQSDAEKPVTVSLRLPRDLYEQAQRHVRIRYPMTLTELLVDGLRLRLETPTDPRDIILSDDNTVIQELQEMIQAAVQAEVGKLSNFMGTSRRILAPEAPAQPMPVLAHDDNTVIQKRVTPAHEQDGPTTPAPSTPDIPYDYNTVIQEHDASTPAQTAAPTADILHDNNTVIQESSETPHTPRAETAPRRAGRPPGAMHQRLLALLAEHPEGLTAEQLRGSLQPTRPIGDTLAGMVRTGAVTVQGKGRGMRYFAAHKERQPA
jgi:hypothetical protein